jgi:L-2-hydroxyglutarate oxidase
MRVEVRMASGRDTADFLVIGGGIIGLAVARELRRQHPAAAITLVEKEPALGAHASGRNSGVLHAGFYYTPDSLKAKFTRVGNAQLTEYCLERRLPIRQCGKLVIARTEEELQRLGELHRRGLANGVTLQLIDAESARAIEPRAKVFQRAIWSPTTSTVDPLAVLDSMLADARSERIDIRLGCAYRGRRDGQILTSGGPIEAGFVVNAAGLYADAVARDFGLSKHYRILPFKGAYLYSDEPPGAMRVHLYPVPDPRFPFLGVHFTVAVDGRLKIGPTAAPAFWREQYGRFENFHAGEALDVALRGLALIGSDAPMRRHAVEELRKSSRRYIVELAAKLAEGTTVRQYTHWGRPGIRAQLYDVRRRALEMDFVIERDERSLHVLNAVSPGFTCAIPVAEHVVSMI